MDKKLGHVERFKNIFFVMRNVSFTSAFTHNVFYRMTPVEVSTIVCIREMDENVVIENINLTQEQNTGGKRRRLKCSFVNKTI